MQGCLPGVGRRCGIKTGPVGGRKHRGKGSGGHGWGWRIGLWGTMEPYHPLSPETSLYTLIGRLVPLDRQSLCTSESATAWAQ